MSYLDLVDSESLFRILTLIDEQLAADARRAGCKYCGQPLHSAAYTRKPRGPKVVVAGTSLIRRSLCCSACRRRTLPPSVLFWGRRVYWGAVVLLLTGAVQGLERRTYNCLCAQFGVARRTLKRWLEYFATAFINSPAWRAMRGRITPNIVDNNVPCALLKWFFNNERDRERALISCLCFLADSTFRWTTLRPQKMPSCM